MLVGQSPDAPFSPDEMDIILGSDQMQPRDSIPPTENISGHPGTETSGDQRLTAATISLVAPASEAGQHSQADQAPKPSSGHSSHLDAPAEMSISAEATGSDSLQHKETESDYPSTEIVDAEPPANFHADAASADAGKQTQSVQYVAPDDKPDLPVALVSHRVEARSSNLPPTEDAHPETQAALHQLASQEAVLVPEGTSQPNQQTQAAPAHAQSSGLGSRSGHAVPAVMLTHLAAAAAASVPQLLGDQPQLPGDQPQLPGDQPQLPGDQPVSSLPVCSAKLAPAPITMAEAEHPDNWLTDSRQHQSQPPQAGSAEAELAEQDAQSPVVLDQSQTQEAPEPCEDASALSPIASALSPIASALSPIASAFSPIAAPPDDAPSRPVEPLNAVSQWEAASGCLIVPDSEEPDSSDQHSHSDMGHTASMQSAEHVTPTAVQPPTEAQPSAGDGSQAQATDTTPSPAVAQGSQDPARLQCLAQQTVVDAGGSAAVDCSPAQTAAEASDPTSLAQSEEQLAAEHVADGLGADTLLIPLPAEGLQHTDWLHSDTEPVPEHVVPPAAVNLPAVKPAEEAAQALKHVAAPFKAQSQLLFQADAVSEGPDRQQQQLVDAAEAAEHTTAPQSMPSLWLHHQDAEFQSDQQQQQQHPHAKLTGHAAPQSSGLIHQQDAEGEGSDQQQQQEQQQQQGLMKAADAVEHVDTPQEAQAALTLQQLEPTAGGLVRQHQLPRQGPGRDVCVEQGPGAHVQPAAECDNLAEHKEVAKREILVEHGNLAEPEILAEPDILAEPGHTGELESLAEPEPSAELKILAELEPPAELEILAEPEPSTELEGLAEHKVSAESETSAEPEILGEHDNVAEHESVPEEQASQLTIVVKQAKILDSSASDAKDGGVYSGKGADTTLASPALKPCTRPSVLAKSTLRCSNCN